MNTPTDRMNAAKEYVRTNLKECCEELLERSETGILCNGCVRLVASMCSFAGPAALGIAETLVKDEAMRRLVASD